MVGENDFESSEEEVRRLFPEEVQGVAVAFVREVERNLAFLETWGFQKHVENASTKAVGYSVSVVFRSSKRDREIRVTYAPNTEGTTGREAISVTIWKDLDMLDTGKYGWDSWLVPDVFLKRFHPDLDLSRLEPTSYEGPVEERLRRCLSAWASVFRNELRSIILGEHWVDGMYVTPFD